MCIFAMTRYLLVYKHGAPSRSRISSTLMQNKMVLSLLAYMFLLVVIGELKQSLNLNNMESFRFV